MAPNIRDSALLNGSTSNNNNNNNNNHSDPLLVVQLHKLASNDGNDADKNDCATLYGPYPSAVPIPWSDSSKEGREGTPVATPTVTTSTTSTTATTTTMTMTTMTPLCDYRDVNSPDEWVQRDGRLVRLTGKHPFNVEPPMAILHQYRFITPASLHYVRNHGACPQLAWETHTIQINVLPQNDDSLSSSSFSSLTLSMDDLLTFPPRELPVTLVCAGNRRKEQNMIRQTIGFNWGPSGVSTNVWKGVLLRELLIRAGIDGNDYLAMNGYHVEFIGVEDLPNKVGPGPFPQAPWGKLVKYGTSIPLARAMNPAYDVLIAYEANGERLQPDHGYPVRLIIPGYIGGRMIKWLAKINVIAHETTNHYHYHDNRILPPHITAEESLTGNWWYKPEYIFNELNINSAIAKPDHNEILLIGGDADKTYPVSGYAYTGGGRMITRVEISTDGGIHWHLCAIDRQERPTPHGMYWCWIWWTYPLPLTQLLSCREIMCRAWDESNNPQPMNPTWNLMGMGNNHAFRVKVHIDKTAAGKAVFRFEHPTQPGQQTGGWMTRTVDKPESAGFGRLLETEAPVAATTTTSTDKPSSALFTMAEIQKHTSHDDLWIVINDKVYDCTEYLELHPGGIESITMNGGQDATEDFVAIHSTKATKMLEKYYIGDLDKSSIIPKTTAAAAASAATEEVELVDEQGNKLALNPRKKVTFKLQNKIVLSRDSFMLDFALPTKDHVLGLPTGKHVFMSAKINGETVLRRYTPISSNYDRGCIKFIIKAYYPCERFPEGGKMSQYVDTLKIGDTLDFKGPVGEFEYKSKGQFILEGQGECHARCFNMMAGGTGITPCMQIAAEILRHPDDPTLISLIFACRVEGDLLMRTTLEEWASHFPDRFKIQYILSDGWPSDWKYSTGFVDRPLFEEHLYPPADDVYNLMCGPPIMIDRGCRPNLEAIGHQKNQMFSF